MRASIIDYVRQELDPTIWDVSGEDLKLQSSIRIQIIDIAMSALDDFEIPESVVKGVYVYGSIMTNQYNEKTDIDCRILLYKKQMDKLYPGITGEEIFDNYLKKQLHGKKLEGTTHPLNCTLVIEGEQDDLGQTPYDPVYDVINEVVIQDPVRTEDKFDPDEEFQQERDQTDIIMEYLDELLRDAKKKTIDFSVLREAIGDVKDPEELKRRLEEKLIEIEADIEQLVDEYEEIKEERTEALSEDTEESHHANPGNVTYKYLERYQYLDILKKLKHIFKNGIEPSEVPEIADALRLESSEDGPYLKKLHVEGAPEDIEIWLVDGGFVRDNFFIDFTMGGHDLVYDFIPDKQIWIDDDTAEDERVHVVRHELDERGEMLEGEDYEEAHEDASEIEKEYREKEISNGP